MDPTPTAREEDRTHDLDPHPHVHLRLLALRARDDARRVYQEILLRLQAAAVTPDGVSATLEQERDRARAVLAKAVRELDRLRPPR